ncbi:MAG: DUF5615 family PIN-like protein [Caldilineaceae bacterium]|nr:DUF5615 family PIN-like protein [Caldilineaceae bacterium]MCB0124922.1 DUF5615 family PIN-like protein [Caldilineaceae bacterium]
MKILLDMNMSHQWVDVFQRQGWEAVHWSSIGNRTDSDELIMQWAIENDHIVFTHDLDFSAILAATNAAAPSVIQLRVQNILPQSMATTVVSVIRICQVQLEEGALLTIDHGKQRIRILPLY